MSSARERGFTSVMISRCLARSSVSASASVCSVVGRSRSHFCASHSFSHPLSANTSGWLSASKRERAAPVYSDTSVRRRTMRAVEGCSLAGDSSKSGRRVTLDSRRCSGWRDAGNRSCAMVYTASPAPTHTSVLIRFMITPPLPLPHTLTLSLIISPPYRTRRTPAGARLCAWSCGIRGRFRRAAARTSSRAAGR